ncbi:sensor histidine kinase [Patulibacter defluvii]|uniref:sensor histidine kinase n=1 Tax=Patulibacter defluvii TaxID=3095358 RepID=UPI002A75A4B0|nr:ATP-binding protein [Patulibacter sp. DM4]
MPAEHPHPLAAPGPSARERDAAGADAPAAGPSVAEPVAADAALALHGALAAVAGLVVTLIWGLTSAGYFWPMWAWFGLAVTVVVHALVRAADAGPGDRTPTEHRLRIAGAAVAALLGGQVLLWAMGGGGYFWPIWPLLTIGTVFAVVALIANRGELRWARARELAERVDVLTRTRSGALDVQAAELRRIERDLHDGAQARLVALSMQLGRAEQRLEASGDDATRTLVLGAQRDATAAIAELRDLARGIAPPVLADRGLVAAVEALARRSAIPVAVDGAVPQRPLPVVESAAYFVVSEALTNAAKHAGEAVARVRLAQAGGRLTIEVADDGRGGADPHGTGLTGLRHRVEALDGTLTVEQPSHGGTIVRAELPDGT